jgi:disulfide bond formation protein DsbB
MSLLQRLQSLDARQASAGIALVAAVTIVGAWIFEAFGFAPCDLCLKQRYAYYAGVPLAALLALFWTSLPTTVARAGLVLLCFIFFASMIFGMYHAGVEWRFWPGPADCTGALEQAASVQDFLKQLQVSKVVRCDEVALRILGLSLAGWNAVISAGLVLVAFYGLVQHQAAKR